MADRVAVPQTETSRDPQAELRGLIDSGAVTKAEVAHQIGYDRSTVGRYIDGKYFGNVNKISAAVMKFLDTRAEQQELDAQLPPVPGYIETPTARGIYDKIAYAHVAGVIACIYGGAGLGKTETSREYTRRNSGAFHITVTPSSSRPQALLARVAARLNLRANQAAYLLEQTIHDYLRNSRKVLLIDEAQHLCPRALEALRSIHDQSGCGIVLLGNEVVYGRLTGGDRSIGFAQLFSRVATKKRLGRPLAGDINALLDAWGVAEDARRFCSDIGRRPGALRGLTNTLRLASMYAQGRGDQTISHRHIKAAWKEHGGDEEVAA